MNDYLGIRSAWLCWLCCLALGCKKPVAALPTPPAKPAATQANAVAPSTQPAAAAENSAPDQPAIAAEQTGVTVSEGNLEPTENAVANSNESEDTANPAAAATPSGGEFASAAVPTADAAAISEERVSAAPAQESSTDGAADGESPQPPAAAAEAQRPANHLKDETSPYLLQHVHNPVDWYPWGPTALAKAKQEHKLIFLSIGYSSCHWCHVMEEESFENEQIAQFMNDHFVCIKVDREERPDLDEIYMTALQIYFQVTQANQTGGWPLNMFLTPDGLPVAGGTYFPPEQFSRVLQSVQEQWQQDSTQLLKLSTALGKVVADTMQGQTTEMQPVPLRPELVAGTLAGLMEVFDAEQGGFGFNALDPERPKFPEAPNLDFLLAMAERNPADPRPRQVLTTTLERMAAGGIWDHVGGGFHRYSTDRFWRIPHFEKMLSDNGQLAGIYARAGRLLERPDFSQVGQQIAAFVVRELQTPEGGFYSSLDADSAGEEGRFYVWTAEELAAAVPESSLAAFKQHFGLTGPPNMEPGYYLPWRLHVLDAAAAEQPADPQLLQQALSAIWDARGQRQRPATDIKVLTSWNGLAIKGLAEVGQLTGDQQALDAARNAAGLLLTKLRGPDGKLAHGYTSGRLQATVFLEDYAFAIQGLLALHTATGEPTYLESAAELMQRQQELFWDTERHGYFLTPSDHEGLIARGKLASDSAQPSGNGISAQNLLMLGRLLNQPEYIVLARQTVEAFSPQMERAPLTVPSLANAADELLRLPGAGQESDPANPPGNTLQGEKPSEASPAP